MTIDYTLMRGARVSSDQGVLWCIKVRFHAVGQLEMLLQTTLEQ
ncbi:hypothetical protein L915_10058 [Phytophthora nicotianae]|uniref:Uncharacterized protein n=1 Tax=Phytophthora nicotianae TaxID=4792 RepID=W2N8L9_PHYNI|nr:hypothetical protein L915_10058 [Phytophthora nicotianae]ETL38453.1 hypothetical protein L916_09967 [Phytophthora nicotianae]ETM44870.1 hypothetical protein L914_09939 [Phytophthora nicotianae]